MQQNTHLSTATIPTDGRTHIRHGQQTYELSTYPTRERWEARADHLRRRVLVSAGLWPTPERCPLQPQVAGWVEHADYTIENVYFQSWPGFYVCGNLYRPRGQEGPFPGVLCPHGHWAHGRLEDGERGSIPARCISLARQDYVAFAYDMIGYNDSGVQLADRGAAGLAAMELEDGGPEQGPHRRHFHAPRHFLWGISPLGLQLWNSIRALDYLSSLPDVDPSRLACTGASGGGTQTFLLCAVDERVQVAAPVNMISAHFQGGCVCENAPNLRLDCTNVEFAALMAPRPLLMVSATGDWTADTPEIEYPAVRAVYSLYGAEDRVATVQVDAPHNYNRQSREAVYAWFGRWLLGVEDAERFRERPYEVDPPQRMRVFLGGDLPARAVTPEQLSDDLVRQAKVQVESLAPRNAATLHAYRELMGVAYRYALNAHQPQACDLQVEQVGVQEREGYRLEWLILGRAEVGERTPALLFAPQGAVGAALVVHPQGRAAAVTFGRSRTDRGGAGAPDDCAGGHQRPVRADGQPAEGPPGTISIAQAGHPGSLSAALLERRIMVLVLDAYGTGGLASLERDTSVAHFLTFNRSDAALRIQDVLNGIAYLRTRAYAVHLVGLGLAGLWCMLARGLACGVAGTVVDAAQFACDDDAAWIEHLFVPQVRRAGDLRTAAALAAPGRLNVHNAAPSFPANWFRQVYQAAGAPQALHIQSEEADITSLLDWLGKERQ